MLHPVVIETIVKNGTTMTRIASKTPFEIFLIDRLRKVFKTGGYTFNGEIYLYGNHVEKGRIWFMNKRRNVISR